nr:MAG TPA: hypothetical protein [Caudoviricetes sp.]
MQISILQCAILLKIKFVIMAIIWSLIGMGA